MQDHQDTQSVQDPIQDAIEAPGYAPQLGEVEAESPALLREEPVSQPEAELAAEPEQAPESKPESEPEPGLEPAPEPNPEPISEVPEAPPPTPQRPPIEMGPVAVLSGPAQAAPRRKRSVRFIVLTSLFVTLAVLVIAAVSYVYFVIHPYGSYDKILPNIYCAGINLGGMTRDEAKAAIEEALRYPSYTVKVILPDCEYEFCPEQEGITLNGDQIARLAYNRGRDDLSDYGMYKAYHAAQKTEYRLDAQTDLAYSLEDIEALARKISEETYIAPTDSTAEYDEENHIVTLTLAEPGREILPETIVAAVDAAFADMIFSDIYLTYDKVEIDIPALRELVRECRKNYSSSAVDPVCTANSETHTIELTMGTLGWKLNGNTLQELAEEAVAQENYGTVSLELEPVTPVDVDITPAYSELACDPVEPYYAYGAVQEGSSGYTLDWEAAIGQIYDSYYGESLSIPMTEIPPQRTAAEVQAVLFRDRLSSYSTSHTANASRTRNLELACQAINGTVINAGQVFSFNGIVGERTAAKGYKSATVYVGTESEEQVGGGVCQVASTIYDAALYAEMEITSRACHTFLVTYVPGGLDATIYWGSLDFCFRNSTDYPIRINASVSGGYVHISIDGTKTNDHVVKLSSTRLSTTPYGTVYDYDSSKPKGYQSVSVSPYTGCTYEAYQYIYDGSGNLLQTNYLGKDTYKKRDQVITVGTG